MAHAVLPNMRCTRRRSVPCWAAAGERSRSVAGEDR
jgi:hypothetical protein